MRKASGILFTLIVIGCMAFAFSPRVDPPAPPSLATIAHFNMLGAQANGGRVVSVGERGLIFVSDNQGETWREVNAPTAATLTAVTFVDERVVVAVGHDAVIVRSEDRGETWRLIQSSPEDEEPLLGVWFDPSGRGFAVGAYGRFEASEDGGLNWEAREVEPSGEDRHLNALARLAPDTFVIVGESGTLLRSTDGGMQWESVPSPYAGSFFGVLALADGGAIAFGMRGHIIRSDDAGASWQELEHEAQASIFGGGVMRDGRVVLVGQNGVVLVSDYSGRDFVQAQGPDRLTRSAVVAADSGLLLMGEGGYARLPVEQLPGGRS